MKLLFISEVFPYPPTSGRRIPLYHTLRLLGREHEITLLCFRQPGEQIGPEKVQHLAQYCRIAGVFPMVGITAGTALRNVVESSPLSFRRYPLNPLAQAVRETLATTPVELVHFFGVNMAQFWHLAPHLPRVLAPNDCPHLLLDRIARDRHTPLYRRLHSILQARKMRRYEACMFPRFPRIYVVTPEDRESLLHVNSTLNVEIIPLGVRKFPAFTARPPGNSGQLILLFTGAMGSKVSEVASIFLCEQVLPRVRSQVPDVQLYLVGNDPPPRVKELAGRYQGVTVTGYVEDLAPYFAMADVYVCPLLAASGIQNRVLEAMAAGRAIVCTSTVAERLEVSPGEHLLVADEPQRFAEHVVRLLRNPDLREAMGKAARAVTREKYTWESVARRLVAVYEEAVVATTTAAQD